MVHTVGLQAGVGHAVWVHAVVIAAGVVQSVGVQQVGVMHTGVAQDSRFQRKRVVLVVITNLGCPVFQKHQQIITQLWDLLKHAII